MIEQSSSAIKVTDDEDAFGIVRKSKRIEEFVFDAPSTPTKQEESNITIDDVIAGDRSNEFWSRQY